jgi:hypothetical protein
MHQTLHAVYVLYVMDIVHQIYFGKHHSFKS